MTSVTKSKLRAAAAEFVPAKLEIADAAAEIKSASVADAGVVTIPQGAWTLLTENKERLCADCLAGKNFAFDKSGELVEMFCDDCRRFALDYHVARHVDFTKIPKSVWHMHANHASKLCPTCRCFEFAVFDRDGALTEMFCGHCRGELARAHPCACGEGCTRKPRFVDGLGGVSLRSSSCMKRRQQRHRKKK